MPTKTGAGRAEQSTAGGHQRSGLVPIQGDVLVWACNAGSSPVKLIRLKTEPPFIPIY